MRKSLILLLLAAALFAAGCQTTVPPSDESQTVSDSRNTPPLPAGEVMDITRDGDRLTVKVKLPAEGGDEVSLLALRDRIYLDNWSANTESLLGIGQIKLDENGEGSLSLTLKEGASDFIVVLNAPSGRYIGEAK